MRPTLRDNFERISSKSLTRCNAFKIKNTENLFSLILLSMHNGPPDISNCKQEEYLYFCTNFKYVMPQYRLHVYINLLNSQYNQIKYDDTLMIITVNLLTSHFKSTWVQFQYIYEFRYKTSKTQRFGQQRSFVQTLSCFLLDF